MARFREKATRPHPRPLSRKRARGEFVITPFSKRATRPHPRPLSRLRARGVWRGLSVSDLHGSGCMAKRLCWGIVLRSICLISRKPLPQNRIFGLSVFDVHGKRSWAVSANGSTRRCRCRQTIGRSSPLRDGTTIPSALARTPNTTRKTAKKAFAAIGTSIIREWTSQ